MVFGAKVCLQTLAGALWDKTGPSGLQAYPDKFPWSHIHSAWSSCVRVARSAGRSAPERKQWTSKTHDAKMQKR